MAVTKKDFIVMAEKAKRSKNVMKEPRDWCYSMAFQMAGFQSLNPNFNPKIYMKAAGADEEDVKQIIPMYRLMCANG